LVYHEGSQDSSWYKLHFGTGRSHHLGRIVHQFTNGPGNTIKSASQANYFGGNCVFHWFGSAVDRPYFEDNVKNPLEVEPQSNE
jgi:hypothetical protein